MIANVMEHAVASGAAARAVPAVGKMGVDQIGRIIRLVGLEYGFSVEQLTGPRRTADLAWARQVGMFLAREFTVASLDQVGAEFGARDHGTVLHACRTVQDRLGLPHEQQEQNRVLMLSTKLRLAAGIEVVPSLEHCRALAVSLRADLTKLEAHLVTIDLAMVELRVALKRGVRSAECGVPEKEKSSRHPLSPEHGRKVAQTAMGCNP